MLRALNEIGALGGVLRALRIKPSASLDAAHGPVVPLTYNPHISTSLGHRGDRLTSRVMAARCMSAWDSSAKSGADTERFCGVYLGVLV
jgi:hypothetical protein